MAWLIRRKRKDKDYAAPLNEQWVPMTATSVPQMLECVRSMALEHDPDLIVVENMRPPKPKPVLTTKTQ